MFAKLADTIATGEQIREIGPRRTELGGIRPRDRQSNWRYAVVGAENGDRFLRFADGNRVFNFRIPNTDGYTEDQFHKGQPFNLERMSDLRDADLFSGGKLQSKGVFQVHKSGPSQIRGTVQDGKRNFSLDILEEDGRWSLRPRQARPRPAALAMQFADGIAKRAADEELIPDDGYDDFRASMGRDRVDTFLEAFGLGPKYVPKEPKKFNCPKCNQQERVWREAHADTGMDEMELRCRNCGYSSESDEPASQETDEDEDKTAGLKPKGKKTRVQTFEDECCPNCEHVFGEKEYPELLNREAHFEENAPPIYRCHHCKKRFTEEELSDEKVKEYDSHGWGPPDFHAKRRENRRAWITKNPDWDKDEEDGEKTAAPRPDRLARLRTRRGECVHCGTPNQPPHEPCNCKTAVHTGVAMLAGAGAGAGVGLLTSKPDEQGRFHRLRDMLLGGAGGAMIGLGVSEIAGGIGKIQGAKTAENLVHYSRNQHEELRPLTYEELIQDRTSGRWEKKPELAAQYVADRKKFEGPLRRKLLSKGVQVDPNNSFLYATIEGKEQFGQGQSGLHKHVAPLAPEVVNQSFFDVVGDGKGRTVFGERGLKEALKRWDTAAKAKALKPSTYMGMTIRPRIEVITPARLRPSAVEKVAKKWDPWIGVDLDGTLAFAPEGKFLKTPGAPIEKMMARVKGWLDEGKTVKIVTARAVSKIGRKVVKLWLKENGLPDLEVTNEKDPGMTDLWDDRATQVERNTGEKVANAAQILSRFGMMRNIRRNTPLVELPMGGSGGYVPGADPLIQIQHGLTGSAKRQMMRHELTHAYQEQLPAAMKSPALRFASKAFEPGQQNTFSGGVKTLMLEIGARVAQFKSWIKGLRNMWTDSPFYKDLYGGAAGAPFAAYRHAPAAGVAAAGGGAIALKKEGRSLPAARRVSFNELLRIVSNDVDTEASEAQRRAGNYSMGHIWLQGMDLTIENPAGSTRSGTARDGKKWSVTMKHAYGYIRSFYHNGKRHFVRSKSDEDHIDMFLGEHPDSETVFVVDQSVGGKFDEHKVMIGFTSEADAKKAYLDNYNAGWKGFDAITALTMSQFKRWMLKGDTGKPLAGAQVKSFLKHAASNYPTFDALTYPLHGQNTPLALGLGALGGAGVGLGIGALRKAKRWVLNEDDEDIDLTRHALTGGLAGLGTSFLFQAAGRSPEAMRRSPEYQQQLNDKAELISGNLPIPPEVPYGLIKDHPRVDLESGTVRPEFLPDKRPGFHRVHKTAAADPYRVEQMIMADASLTYYYKQELMAQLEAAKSQGLPLNAQQLTSAGLGALAGWLMARMAGFGNMGQMFGGLAGGIAGGVLAAPPSEEQIFGAGYYRP